MLQCPLGFLLHSSRSGIAQSELAEFHATVNYAVAGANGLGWHVSVGPSILAEHISARNWGWNARSPASGQYIAVEFAQARLGDLISDAQIDAFRWYVRQVQTVWPAIPLAFVTHSQLTSGIADGKTDPVPRDEAPAFIARVEARLALWRVL